MSEKRKRTDAAKVERSRLRDLRTAGVEPCGCEESAYYRGLVEALRENVRGKERLIRELSEPTH